MPQRNLRTTKNSFLQIEANASHDQKTRKILTQLAEIARQNTQLSYEMSSTQTVL
ncbi:hypothetical protein DSUL_20206 [Desulfovibrionales bacterium]